MRSLTKLFRRTSAPARRTGSFRPSLESLETREQPAVSLGAAGQYAILSINSGVLLLNSSHLTGDVGLGPNGTSTLQKTDITGAFYADQSSSPDLSSLKNFSATGGIHTGADLLQAQNDAVAASAADAALAPTQTLGNVTSSITVTGNGGENVISLTSLNYNAKTLTISGNATETFVFNVSGNWTFAQSQIKLVGGVTANHVLFNFPTTGSLIDMYKAANKINGTFLAPYRSVNYHNPADFDGAIIAQNISIHSDGILRGATFVGGGVTNATTSLSGFVYTDENFNNVRDAGDDGFAGIVVTLTGTDSLGNSVTKSATTDAQGRYTFTGLSAGTYSLSVPLLIGMGYVPANPNVGSLGGSVSSATSIGSITLNDGDQGINYNFGEQLAG